MFTIISHCNSVAHSLSLTIKSHPAGPREPTNRKLSSERSNTPLNNAQATDQLSCLAASWIHYRYDYGYAVGHQSGMAVDNGEFVTLTNVLLRLGHRLDQDR
jgi:hypothetical protein